MFLFFKFLKENVPAFGTADFEFSDPSRHPNVRRAARTAEEARSLSVSDADGSTAKRPQKSLQKCAVGSVFLLTLQNVSGEHTEKGNSTENKLDARKDEILESKIQNRHQKPKKDQMTVETVGTIASQHKASDGILQTGKKAHQSLLLPLVTMANRRISWIKDAAREAT